MEDLLAKYWPLIVAIVMSDVAAGYVPDKYLPYVGIARRIIRAIGKKDGD